MPRVSFPVGWSSLRTTETSAPRSTSLRFRPSIGFTPTVVEAKSWILVASPANASNHSVTSQKGYITESPLCGEVMGLAAVGQRNSRLVAWRRHMLPARGALKDSFRFARHPPGISAGPRENVATSRHIGRIRALRNQVCAKPTFPRKPGLVPVSPGWRGSPERRALYAPAKKV